jgi:ribose 5-phosphate isomerase B
MMHLGIGADHAGVELKAAVTALLKGRGCQVTDHGTHGPDSVDYPDFAHPVAQGVETGQYDLGIVICGSGNGINMTVNKYQGVRSALCWEPELASLARQHNNANVLALPARFVSSEKALEIVAAFLDATFEGGRHERRVAKISCS